MPSPDFCLFCGIVDGSIPSEQVYADDQVVAFRDIAPAMPVHVLVVPRLHVPDVATLAQSDVALLGAVFGAAAHVAQSEGLTGGYRLLANTGPDSGQTVFHLHVHVLGGKNMGALAG